MITPRSGSQGSSSAPPVQTIEVVRRRARHRLIGAAVLVLAGVLVFPLLFDTEPRPVVGDVPIEIPSRGEVSTLPKPDAKEAPVTTADAKPVAKATAAPASGPLSAGESLGAREQVVDPVAATPDTAAKARPEVAVKPAEPAVTDTNKDTAKADKALKEAQASAAAKAKIKESEAESARAKALLENKSPAGGERLVVQVGAFAEAASARATRLKLERAGMTTYTHVADTPSGKLIRVRVGPYATRAEADKAAAKVKALGLPARILAL